MRKKRNLAKVSVVLLILITITAAAVLGIASLIKALTNGFDFKNPASSAAPTQNSDIENNSITPLPTNKPFEDKVAVIDFTDDILTIMNPGTDILYSYNTGNDSFTIDIRGREVTDFGILEIQDSEFFEHFSVSEEKESIRIVMDSTSDFNTIATTNENSIIFSFVQLKNKDTIIYRNDLDRHYMAIDDAALCSRSDSELKNYEEIYDSFNLIKRIVIPKKYMPELEDEKVILNDGYLKSYEIVNKTNDIEMIFKLEEELVLYPNARDYNSTLTFVKYRAEENLIVLDAGHGGLDGGAVSAGEEIIEKDIVLKITSMVAEKLKQKGFNVYNLRQEDVFLGLRERTDIANHLGADSVISIHINSFDDTSVNGTLTMYKTSVDLARSIQKNLVSSLMSTDMGLVQMMDRAILNGAEMDSVIVEMGFLTNPIEAEKLNSEEYQEKAASGIADGIEEYYRNKEINDGN